VCRSSTPASSGQSVVRAGGAWRLGHEEVARDPFEATGRGVAHQGSFMTAMTVGRWGVIGARPDKRSRSSLVWLERPHGMPWCSRWMRWIRRMAGVVQQREALMAEEEDGGRFEMVVREAIKCVGEVLGDAMEVGEEEMASLLDRRR
jgi:hypothetical protein